MESDVVRKLMEDYKWKEEGFTVGYGGNVLSKKEEWGEPNGFQIDEKNCEFKWFARRGENKKIFNLKTPEQYTRAITELIKACQDKDLPCYEYPSPPNYQSGLRITIIDETNGSQTDDEKADAVNEWKKNHLKEFLELKENVLKKIKEEAPMSQEEEMNEIKELLVNNHNIILHGAPGTGKTYLAKEIAKKMIFGDSFDTEKDLTTEEQTQFNEQCGFVQFHQSYDYTDFVEGLRPVNQKGNQIGFERKDGVFKTFCNKALLSDGLDNAYDTLIQKYRRKELTSFNQKTNTPIMIKDVDEQNNIVLQSESEAKKDDPKNEYKITKEGIKKILEKYNTLESLDKISNIKDEIRKCISPEDSSAAWINSSGYWAVAKYLLEKINKKYIFIIDEINRGEMSKIFGELFFSVDPSYRGKKGKIKTQYANLQEKPNEFDSALGIKQNVVKENGKDVDKNIDNYGHFFVPENVYIIGTMNDIDRSVESMDFAMRRRFAFKEIKAEDSRESMFENGTKWKNGNNDEIDVSSCLENIKNRMNNLNNAILNKEFHLGQAYQIGGAYFLKFANYCKTDDNKKAVENQDEAYKSLWTNHLECVIREYLRGMDNVEGKDGKLEKLKDAYDYKVIYKDDGTIDTNAKNGKPSAEAKGDHVDGKDKQTEETDV